MIPENIIMLDKHLFSIYLGIKFPSLCSRDVIHKNKFGKLETNTPKIWFN